jgi:hypothetical protein
MPPFPIFRSRRKFGVNSWPHSSLMLAGCGQWTELSEVSCPPEGTDLSYTNWAGGFFAEHCNSCHSVSSVDRRGAPIAYVFDTHDQVYALRERIFLRAAGDNTSMPPGPDDPSAEERDRLAEWIACDAPRD